MLGAGGAIGRALVDALVSAGRYQVIAASRGASFAEASVSSYVLDLRDPSQAERLLHRAEPDWVVDCAARWTGLDDDFTVLDDNVRMTLNVARYLPPSVTRFVYLSSSAVSRRLRGAYAAGKACEEQIVRARCRETPQFTIWRPYHVVSPYEQYQAGRSHLVTNLSHEIFDERVSRVDLTRNGHIHLRLTWVRDLTDAILSDLERGPDNRTYDVGSTQCVSIAEVAAAVVRWGLKAGAIAAGPELVTGEATGQPIEPYQPDVACSTSAIDTIEQCLAIKYANAHV